MSVRRPALPIFSTVEEAMRLIVCKLPALLNVYVLPWVVLLAASVALDCLLLNSNQTSLDWLHLPLTALINAVFVTAMLRITLLGESPSTDLNWWFNGTFLRVAAVVLTFLAGFAALQWSVRTVMPTVIDAIAFLAGGLPDDVMFASTFAGTVLVLLPEILLVLCVFFLAPLVVATGGFDWRQHWAILAARPVKLAFLVAFASILVMGFQYSYHGAIAWIPTPGVPNFWSWPTAMLVTFERRLPWFPFDFLRDSFLVMLLAAAYRRLTSAASINPFA